MNKKSVWLTTVSGAATVIAGSLSLTAAQGAIASTPPAVTLIGTAGRLPTGGGLIIVEAQLALGRNTNPQRVATKLLDIPVASQAITGGKFRIPVPESAVIRRAERLGNGNVNFVMIIDSGTWTTDQYVPAPLTASAAPGNTVAAAEVGSRRVRVPRFPPFKPMARQIRHAIAAAGGLTALAIRPGTRVDVCVGYRYGNEKEDTTRIGEIHVANTSGMTDKFQQFIQADSTITVGQSSASLGPWNVSGSLTITNSIGTSGYWTAPKGTVIYADGHIYYQRYKWGPNKYCPTPYYTNQADHSVGDVFPGNQSPPQNPYSGGSDTGQAATYGGIATLWGFTFGGSTGFSTNIKHNYSNTGSRTTYVCGTFPMPYVPIIYNGT